MKSRVFSGFIAHGGYMSIRQFSWNFECVLIDLNTQRDFCDEGGSYPVQNLKEFIPSLKIVIQWAQKNRAPIVSSLDSHRRWEMERQGAPIHCIDGSQGQKKMDFTLLPSYKMVEGDNTLAVPIDLFLNYQQVIFRKRTPDFFANPKVDRFLTQLPVQEYLIFGAGIEDSIKTLALGLLARHKKVGVLMAACGYWSLNEADLAIRQVVAKGARLITMEELQERRLKRGPLWRLDMDEAAYDGYPSLERTKRDYDPHGRAPLPSPRGSVRKRNAG